jgi:hypothetical protein
LLKAFWFRLVVDGHRFHFRHHGSRTSSPARSEFAVWRNVL